MSSSPGRPTAAPPTLARIPDDLKALPRWVVWRYTPRPDGSTWAKPLYTPATGAAASHSNPDSWSSYTEAVAAYQSGTYDGLGFVFEGNDGYVGIDLDKAMRADGTLKPWALYWVKTFARVGAYIETSPSGQGVHIIVPTPAPWGDGQQPKHKMLVPKVKGDEGGAAEIYTTRRYFTMSGHPVPEIAQIPIDHPTTADDAVAAFYRWFLTLEAQTDHGAPMTNACPPTAPDNPETVRHSPPMAHEDIVRRCRAMHNGKGTEFRQLFDHAPSEDEDESRGDWALAGKILYWTQDLEQAEELMRQSRRVRPKWDSHPTYLRETLRKCLHHKLGRESQGKTEFYRPKNGPTSPETQASSPSDTVNTVGGPDDDSSSGETGDHTLIGAWTMEQVMAMPHTEMAQGFWAIINLLTNPTVSATDARTAIVTWLATRRFPGVPLPEDAATLIRIHLPEVAHAANLSPARAGKSLKHCAEVGLVERELHRNPQNGHTFLYAGAPEEVVLNTVVIPEAEERKKAKKDSAERRKQCKHCGASAFLHETTCLACGVKNIDERIDGRDDEIVAHHKERLLEKHKATGWERGIETVVIEPDDNLSSGPLATEGQFSVFVGTTNLIMEAGLRLHVDVLDNFYNQWCHEEDEEKAPRGALHRWLEEQGCTLSADFWYGIGLVSNEPEEPQEPDDNLSSGPPPSPLPTQLGFDDAPGPYDEPDDDWVPAPLDEGAEPETAAPGGRVTIRHPSDHSVCGVEGGDLEDAVGGPGNKLLPGPRRTRVSDHQRRYGADLLDQLGIATPGAQPG